MPAPDQAAGNDSASARALKAALRASIALDPPTYPLTSGRTLVMPEPSTSTAAGAALGWKAIGGAAGVAAGGAGLAALIVMLMMPPRTPREWAVGIISTVIGSVAGGAAVIMHFGLQAWTHDVVGLVAVLGIVFACGLPAWAIVRWVFTWIIRRQGKDIAEVVHDAGDALADAKKTVLP